MSDDRIILTPIVAALIAIFIAYLRVWSLVKEARREGLREVKENNDLIKRDLKDYIDIRLQHINERIEDVRNEIKQIKQWIQRTEDRLRE